jgi:Ca2+-binding EF-hand superfamily protein
MYIVNYIASNEEKQNLMVTFRTLDVDHDGMVSKEELY